MLNTDNMLNMLNTDMFGKEILYAFQYYLQLKSFIWPCNFAVQRERFALLFNMMHDFQILRSVLVK